jgi:hypothetical protein
MSATRPAIRNRARLALEQLERREVPATLISATKMTYQDIDGDNVTVTLSKPLLNAGNVNDVFTFFAGSVNGDNTLKQQLRSIDLTGIGAPATGVGITTVATRSLVNGGDGFAALGQVDATGIDLGTVKIDGDLGRILAGDADTKTTGVAGLFVHSMGRFGTTTGATTLNTAIQGKLGLLQAKSDVKSAFITVSGGVGGVDGKIGAGFIGGSLDGGRINATGAIGALTIKGDIIGGAGNNTGQIIAGGALAGLTLGGSLRGGSGSASGSVLAAQAIGPVRIVGRILGGQGVDSGRIQTEATLGSVTVGGSVIAGTDPSGFFAEGAIGPVRVGQDVLRSAIVSVNGTIASVTIGGSLKDSGISANKRLGPVHISGNATGNSPLFSEMIRSSAAMESVLINGDLGGEVFAQTTMGTVTIGGSVRLNGAIATSEGGIRSVRVAGDVYGEIFSNDTLGSVLVGGSLLGLSVPRTGFVESNGAIGEVRIGGDVVGGSASGNASLESTGAIVGKRLASLSIGGSLIAGIDNTTGTFRDNGAIRADNDIGNLLIKGSIIGNSTNPAIISARGKAVATATADLAIGKLTVRGRVEFAQILAGVDVSGVARNADAQIGSVYVGGDWIASNLVAGAVAGADGKFGTADDAKMSGASVKDEVGINSRIASVTIGGQVLGTVSGSDHFGIVAEQIGAVKIGGTPLALTAGIGNDDIPLGITGDFFRINEI